MITRLITGDNCVMYRNIESLCYVLGTNIVMHLSCTSKNKPTNTLTDKEMSFVVTRGRESDRENWMKMIERYKLLVINQF